jgi:hypothetical protein
MLRIFKFRLSWLFMIPSRKKLDLSYIICRSVIESITPIRKQDFYHITTVPPVLAPAHNLLFISYFRLRNKRAMSALPRVHITKLPSMSSSWQCRSTGISDSFSMTPTAIIQMNSYLSSMEELQTNIHRQSLGRRSKNESSSTAVLWLLLLHLGRQLATLLTTDFARHKIQIERKASLVTQYLHLNPIQLSRRSLERSSHSLLLRPTRGHCGGLIITALPWSMLLHWKISLKQFIRGIKFHPCT